MEFAGFVMTHNNLALAEDTLDSFEFWANTKKTFILVDGAYWDLFENVSADHEVLKGLRHGVGKSPFKNLAFGLMQLYKRYPTGVDFYVYLEQDVLFIGDQFKEDLKSGGFFYGTNRRPQSDMHRPAQLNLDLLDEIVGTKVEHDIYVLGCIQFMSKHFVKRLIEDEILARLLKTTKDFPPGEFPGFRGFAVEEQIYSSTCNALFKNSVRNLEPFSRYACRWQPEIHPEEISAGTSIVHPLKNVKDPIRKFYRKFRDRAREF